jgi:hypothetical protein
MQKFKTVAEFMDSLDDAKKAQVEELRSIIKKSNPNLEETIKWNAPSYMLNGENRITFNLLNKEGMVKLVLHMGATRKENKKSKPIMTDNTGLIEWRSDIRGVVSFPTLLDITINRQNIVEVIDRWLVVK